MGKWAGSVLLPTSRNFCIYWCIDLKLAEIFQRGVIYVVLKFCPKLRESSLIYVPVFVVLYLEIVENTDTKSTFFSYPFIEMSLMTSSIRSSDTNCHFWILIIIINAH